MKNLYSIQFVSKITGINAHTIRAWEKRYQVIIPQRDQKGRRQYTQQHIDKLTILNSLIQIGHKISELSKLNYEELQEYSVRFNKTASPALNHQNVSEPVDLSTTLQNLLMALGNYKLDIISHELEKIKSAVPVRELALNLIQPLFVELGQLVSKNFLNIAQEQALLSLLKFHIGHILFKNYQFKNNSHKTVVLSSIDGDENEFSILLSALLCCHYQINCYYLGTGISLKALAEAGSHIRPDLYLLGSSNPSMAFSLSTVEQFCIKLDMTLPQESQIWLLGLPQMEDQSFSRTSILPSIHSVDKQLNNLLK